MASTKLNPRQTPGAGVEEISRSNEYRLSIPAGSADKYRLAQLDDYTQAKRGRFPLRCPLSLSLSARASSNSIPGTLGFGLWNVEGKSFVVQRCWCYGRSRYGREKLSPYSTTGSEWISRAGISLSKVSSPINPCRAGSPLLAQDDASILGKSDR